MSVDNRQPKADRTVWVVVLVAVLTLGMVVAGMIVALAFGTDIPDHGMISS